MPTDKPVEKMDLQPVVRQDTHDSRGEACHNGLAPQTDRFPVHPDLPGLPVFFEGPDRVPVKDHNRQDRAELDDNKEHLPEDCRNAQRHELIQQDHMTGAADGKPFRNAFHQTEQRGFQKLNHEIYILPLR